MKRAVAITLKIPDNTAYTAMVALRSLGVNVERVERSEIWMFENDGNSAALRRRVESDESIFNPNKHRVSVLSEARPRDGEVWVEPFEGNSQRAAAIAWRLYGGGDRLAPRRLLEAAVERLLCNPAIERAVYPLPGEDEKSDGGE
jgi:phosphoribosylformylglycinamidine (FGAM) synthase PurS component